jgi:hypothetical protein
MRLVEGSFGARSTLIALALFIPFAACKASNLTPADGALPASETTCDPLAPKPIALGTIVGVGQDEDGTLYVDAANGVFVSAGGRLIRQHVTGSGQSGATQFLFGFEPPGDDGSSARNLLVETSGSTAIAMALGPTGSKSFLGQSDAGVTSLTLVAASTVAGMAVVNTPNVIEYVGDVANGDVVLATVPLNDDLTALDGGVQDGGLSIFYGPPDALAERTVTAFEESLSGNGTLTFLVGDVPYLLAFGTVQGPDAGSLGFALAGLTPQGGAQFSVTLRSPTPTADPPGLSFTCLAQQ